MAPVVRGATAERVTLHETAHRARARDPQARARAVARAAVRAAARGAFGTTPPCGLLDAVERIGASADDVERATVLLVRTYADFPRDDVARSALLLLGTILSVPTGDPS